MKRLVTVMCAAVLAFGLAFTARPIQAQSIALGVEGGATFSKFHVGNTTSDVSLNNQTGLRIAGVLRVGLGGLLGLESGVGLTQKGATAPPSETGLTTDVDFNVDYVTVPLLLTLGIPTGPSPVHPRLFAGPQVGFQSNCSVSVQDATGSASTDCDASNLIQTNNTDFGLVFGGGLDFGLGGPLALTVDGRYELGLTDINDTPDPSPSTIRNRSFVVSGGLLFRLP